MGEELSRLYELFESERASFTRWSYVLAAVVVFIALTYFPYAQTLRSLHRTEVDIEARADEIEALLAETDTAESAIRRAAELMGDASAYRAMYDDMERWVADLDRLLLQLDRQERRLAGLRGALGPEALSTWPRGRAPRAEVVHRLRERRPELMAGHDQDPCFWHIEFEWIRCEIEEARADIDAALGRVLYDRSASHVHTRRLAAAIDEVRERFERGLGDAVARGDLVDWTRTHLEREQRAVRSWYEEMARLRGEKSRERSQQAARLAVLEDERRALEQRRAEIADAGVLDTPVGRLPVGFGDLIRLLPALLLAGATGLVRSHARMIRLRHWAHRLQGSFPGIVDQRGYWRLITPLWLDPLRSHALNLAVLALLLLPVAVALGVAWDVRALQLRLAVADGAGAVPAELVAGAVLIGYLAAYVHLVLVFTRYRAWVEAATSPETADGGRQRGT